MSRTVKLTIELWRASIPTRWTDFEVKFAPADTGFSNWTGQHIAALKGSELKSDNAEVLAMFDGMIKSGYAEEVEVKEAPKVIAKPIEDTKKLE